MTQKHITLIIKLLYLCIYTSSAQNFDLGSWNILNIKYTLDKKWSVFGEAQLRSLKFYDDFHYHEYKGGFHYKVDKNLILTSVGRHQKEDGSFSSFENSSECDLRFVYSALSICKLFNNFQHINTAKAKDYIDSCYNFDGGYGLRPKD